MKWTIQQIKEQPDHLLRLDHQLAIKEPLMDRSDEILDVKDVHVEGYYTVFGDEVLLHATIEAQLVLASTRTLAPVDVTLTIPVDERYVWRDEGPMDIEDDAVTMLLEEPVVDIAEATMDNILLHLPAKVIGPGEDDAHLPSGDDWVVMTEDAFIDQQMEKRANTVDPRLAKLQALLDNQDD